MQNRRNSILLACLLVLALASSALADWSVTVTWTRSIGPDLDYESALLDGATQCTVQEADPTTCQFVVPTLTGQAIVIRSTNSQGAYSETAPLLLSAVPAPASGVMATITYVSP